MKTQTDKTKSDISLKIISIPDKEWKEYRNQASQDELMVLGIGMKLWLNKTRKSALCFVLALLLTVAVGVVVALFANLIAGIAVIGVGYLIFCTLSMRRHFVKTSLSQTKSKLNAENKKALDAEFKTSGGATFAEVLITIVLCTICEPYIMAVAVLSAIFPSVLNTKLVVPEGYGFEALEEIKGYYAEKSFLSEAIEICIDSNRKTASSKSTETYRNQYGEEIELDADEQPYVINDRGEKVYKDKYGNEYISRDSGKTVHKKDDDGFTKK